MKKLMKNAAIYTQIEPNLWKITEEHIFASLGDSGFCQIIREENHSTLSVMIVFLRTGGDKVSAYQTLEALYKSSHLASLPSEYLKNIAYSQDLEDEWKWQRFWSLLLAKCFLFTLLNKTENQLEDEKKASYVTKWDAELIELTALRYQALYRLIKKGFKYMHKLLPSNLINKKPWDIFMEICTEEIDAVFIVRTESFVEILTDKMAKKWEKLTEIEIKRDNFQFLLEEQYLFNSQTLLIIVETLIKKAKKNNLLSTYLENYFVNCRAIGYAMVDALKARNSSGKVSHSEVWEHGERYIFHNNLPIKPRYKT